MIKGRGNVPCSCSHNKKLPRRDSEGYGKEIQTIGHVPMMGSFYETAVELAKKGMNVFEKAKQVHDTVKNIKDSVDTIRGKKRKFEEDNDGYHPRSRGLGERVRIGLEKTHKAVKDIGNSAVYKFAKEHIFPKYQARTSRHGIPLSRGTPLMGSYYNPISVNPTVNSGTSTYNPFGPTYPSGPPTPFDTLADAPPAYSTNPPPAYTAESAPSVFQAAAAEANALLPDLFKYFSGGSLTLLNILGNLIPSGEVYNEWQGVMNYVVDFLPFANLLYRPLSLLVDFIAQGPPLSFPEAMIQAVQGSPWYVASASAQAFLANNHPEDYQLTVANGVPGMPSYRPGQDAVSIVKSKYWPEYGWYALEEYTKANGDKVQPPIQVKTGMLGGKGPAPVPPQTEPVTEAPAPADNGGITAAPNGTSSPGQVDTPTGGTTGGTTGTTGTGGTNPTTNDPIPTPETTDSPSCMQKNFPKGVNPNYV